MIDGERAVKHLQIVMEGRESLLGCEAVVLPKPGTLEVLQQVAIDSCVGLCFFNQILKATHSEPPFNKISEDVNNGLG